MNNVVAVEPVAVFVAVIVALYAPAAVKPLNVILFPFTDVTGVNGPVQDTL